MNKILIRSIFLIIVISLALLILFKSRSPFGNSNSSFASEPKEEITRIEFFEDGEKLYLEKKGENWLINGEIEARKSGVLFILRVLRELKIKSPVSSELFISEISSKKILPVRVKVFENNRLLKTFFVYKTSSNSYGNIMKLSKASKPYIVYIPGYEGNIGSGFILNELFWKSYTVFNLLPSEIESVQLENLSDAASSFSIINRDHHFILSGDTHTAWDSSRIIRYISYFAWIPFESWAFDIGKEERRQIEAQQPLYIFTVVTSSGRKIVLTLWGMPAGNSVSNAIDSDRLLGKTGESEEFFIMRYFDIDPLIKKRSWFFTED